MQQIAYELRLHNFETDLWFARKKIEWVMF